MSEESAKAAAADPNYILSQDEFYKAIRPLYRMHGETQGQVSNSFRELESAAGWIMLSLAFWLALTGYYAVKGDWQIR
ncbi:MAG: hypothetical protein QOF85_952 [Solirubrobacterales bacterium]|jgi:hypothetical protein|nr:hypothetical protein [Solirubrobacterales bacterium]